MDAEEREKQQQREHFYLASLVTAYFLAPPLSSEERMARLAYTAACFRTETSARDFAERVLGELAYIEIIPDASKLKELGQ